MKKYEHFTTDFNNWFPILSSFSVYVPLVIWVHMGIQHQLEKQNHYEWHRQEFYSGGLTLHKCGSCWYNVCKTVSDLVLGLKMAGMKGRWSWIGESKDILEPKLVAQRWWCGCPARGAGSGVRVDEDLAGAAGHHSPAPTGEPERTATCNSCQQCMEP